MPELDVNEVNSALYNYIPELEQCRVSCSESNKCGQVKSKLDYSVCIVCDYFIRVF